MRSATTHVNIHKVTSFDTVLSALTKLKLTLSKDRLDQFLLFNDAYLVITTAIKNAADHNYFGNPVFIEKFTVNFAHYYFRAVNETISGSSDLPAAWKTVNEAAKNTASPKFIFLLMGANAHINHDLPLALLQTMNKEEADDLIKDILKIDKLLMKSGREIIALFSESNNALDFLKRRFIFIYYRPTMYMILYWRVKAWRNYKSIKKVGVSNSSYQVSSINISNRFLKLAKLFN